MRPIIKWPGGKSGELDLLLERIPPFQRYIEPFFGGGALFFRLKPQRGLVNDISNGLMACYRLIQRQDPELRRLLEAYDAGFAAIQDMAAAHAPALLDVYQAAREGALTRAEIAPLAGPLVEELLPSVLAAFPAPLVRDEGEFAAQLKRSLTDKVARTVRHEAKSPFGAEDRLRCLVTAFASGYYMYFRKVFNDILLARHPAPSLAYEAANFYFVREYCYGAMFRYNGKGEFNIPYGGMSYNKKRLAPKVALMFSGEMDKAFRGIGIHCADFEKFLTLAIPNENDFIFLDPPYDTHFSSYDGKEFSPDDHRRLAALLRTTPAKFLLIIKNTPLIQKLYGEGFYLYPFDNSFTYNIRSRNERRAEHLLVTNYPAE